MSLKTHATEKLPSCHFFRLNFGKSFTKASVYFSYRSFLPHSASINEC